MSESIVEFIGKITPSKPLMSALLAVIPVTEIKGSILYAAASEGELWLSVVAAYLASVLLSMILAFFFPWILSLAERSPRIERVTAAVTDRLMRRAEDIAARTRSAGEREKKNALLFAVYAFVAVPLPMTGVWSGALLSAMLRSDRGRTIFALAAGNFTAGGIVLAVALLAGDHAALVFRIFLIAAIGMILLAFVRSWIERPRSDSHDE